MAELEDRHVKSEKTKIEFWSKLSILTIEVYNGSDALAPSLSSQIISFGQFSSSSSEAYSEYCQIYKMEHFAK